jgi:hypothetical protein
VLLERSFVLLLTLPVVTTLTGIFKHVIGLQSLSLYAPIILTFAFYQLGQIDLVDVENEVIATETNFLRGLQFGLALFFVVFISSVLIYKFLAKIRMHYIPKTTIVLIGVSISIILATILATLVFEKKGLIYLNSFSIIMIATLSESFVSTLSRKKLKYTIIVGLQTLLIALIAYSIISLQVTRELVLNNAIILILALLLVNLYVGKFIGLRLTEYWRFRDLLLKDSVNKPNVSKNNTDKKKS